MARSLATVYIYIYISRFLQKRGIHLESNESNNLKNIVVLISVAGEAKENKRNISVINRDSLLHSKTRINTCFVM